jgi:hypothetical protein
MLAKAQGGATGEPCKGARAPGKKCNATDARCAEARDPCKGATGTRATGEEKVQRNLCPVRSCQQSTFACCWRLLATDARCAEAKDPCKGATGTTFARSLSKATFACGYATQRQKEGQQGRQQEPRLCLCALALLYPTVRT